VKIEKSSALAYWIGIVQTDGYLKKYLDKTGGYKRFKYFIVMHVVTSLPMLKRFQKISLRLFNRKAKIHKFKKGWVCKIGVTKLLPFFEELDINFSKPPKPPSWCLERPGFFGAYLAGIIDGDGTVDIKRPRYPQCAIQISSDQLPIDLKKAIKNCLNCGVNNFYRERWANIDGRFIYSHENRTEFYLSSKNYLFFQGYVLPWISLHHKRYKISTFVNYLKRKYTYGSVV